MITRPVLRYHGGKFRLREWVINFFPPHDVYVEPFGGAASVLLAKYPSRIEVYNDLSSDVVNLFRVLREPCTANRLRELLELTPFSREEFMSCWELADLSPRVSAALPNLFGDVGPIAPSSYPNHTQPQRIGARK